MDLLNMSRKQIAQAYRTAYAQHLQITVEYQAGNVNAETMRASANQLKLLRAAFKIADE